MGHGVSLKALSKEGMKWVGKGMWWVVRAMELVGMDIEDVEWVVDKDRVERGSD